MELLFLSVKKAVYANEMKFNDTCKDQLAGCALQAMTGNYKSENESRSALRRFYLVPLTKDLEYWAESERRALNSHRKQHSIPRGKATVFHFSRYSRFLKGSVSDLNEVKDITKTERSLSQTILQ